MLWYTCTSSCSGKSRETSHACTRFNLWVLQDFKKSLYFFLQFWVGHIFQWVCVGCDLKCQVFLRYRWSHLGYSVRVLTAKISWLLQYPCSPLHQLTSPVTQFREDHQNNLDYICIRTLYSLTGFCCSADSSLTLSLSRWEGPTLRCALYIGVGNPVWYNQLLLPDCVRFSNPQKQTSFPWNCSILHLFEVYNI